MVKLTSGQEQGSYRLVSKEVSSTFTHNLPGISMDKHLIEITDRNKLRVIQSAITESANNRHSNNTSRLPICGDFTLDSKTLKKVNNDYIIRPYIKGTACMLYWDENGHCYIIDKRFQIFELRDTFYQAAIISECL
eukprot:UN29503